MASPTQEDIDNLDENIAKLDAFINGTLSESVTLGNQSIKSLTGVVNAIGAVSVKGTWTTGTSYVLKDIVTYSGVTYVCVLAHTAGTFSTDLTNLKWVTWYSFLSPITTVTSSTYTVLTTHLNNFFEFNTASNTISVNLPAKSTVQNGFSIFFRKTSASNTLEFNPDSSETIEGSLTKQYTTVCHGKITLSDSEWRVVDSLVLDGAVTTDKLADSSVTTAKLADGAVTANKAPIFTYMMRFRRPSLVYNSSFQVTFESGLYTGVSTDYTMLFPDGSLRTVTSTTYTMFNMNRNAVFSGSGLQSGLSAGLSEVNNTWYAIYAVKCDDLSQSFVLVGDTTFPNEVSTLDTKYGSTGWVYLGMIRTGDNSANDTDILRYVHSGETTIFGKSFAEADRAKLAGIRLATTTSNTLSWAYSSGSTGASIPAHIRIGHIAVEGADSTSLSVAYNDGITSNYLYSRPSIGTSTTATSAVHVMMDITKGVYATQSSGDGLSIYLAGFKDRYLSY